MNRINKLATATATLIGIAGSLLAGLVFVGDGRWERRASAAEVAARDETIRTSAANAAVSEARAAVHALTADALKTAQDARVAAAEAKVVADMAKQAVDRVERSVSEMRQFVQDAATRRHR